MQSFSIGFRDTFSAGRLIMDNLLASADQTPGRLRRGSKYPHGVEEKK